MHHFRTTTVGLFLTVWLALSLGIAAAQPADIASPDEASAVFDINTIDPETFQAVAARLPEGMEPEIDGILDDEAWALAPPSGDFVQREPLYGAPSTEKTEFRILYDAKTHLFRNLGLRQQSGRNPRKRDETGLGSAARRSDQDHHGHVSRPP